jgi:type IV pilus assembly protein PilM
LLSNRRKHLIGLDIGSTSIKLVELAESQSGFKLRRMGLTRVEDSESPAAYEHALVCALREHSISKGRVATSVAGRQVAVRNLTFPKLSREELDGAVWYEGGQVIAFDINDAYVDYAVVPQYEGSSNTDVIFAAATREEVNAKTELVQACGLDPRLVSVDALVLLEALLRRDDLPPTSAVLNVGARFSNLGIAKHGAKPFVRDIEIAGDAFTRAIAESRSISLEEAEQIKVADDLDDPKVACVVDSITDRLAREITRSIIYYHTRDQGSKVDRIYLCGGGSKLRGLDKSIAAATDTEVEHWSPLDSLDIDGSRFGPEQVGKLTPFLSVAAALAMKEDPN